MGVVNPTCIQDSEETTHEEDQEVQPTPNPPADWDMDLGWSRMFRVVIEDKGQRRNELLVIERRKRELEDQQRQIDHILRSIDQAKYNLEVREQKLLEVEDILPLARQKI